MVKSRWHDGEIAMARWRKRDCTMVEMRWYDGESQMVRWLKRDGTMVKTRLRDGENTMTRWCDVTMDKMRFHHRAIAISPSYHSVCTIVPSCIGAIDKIKNHYRSN
jgi:hypothetical protein